MDLATANHFAAMLHSWRKKRGLSFRMAADRSGGRLSSTTWRRMERAFELQQFEPRSETLLGIATALDLDPQEVFEWAGREYEPFAAHSSSAATASSDEPALTIAADVGKLKNPAHHRAVAALVRQLLAEEEAEQ